MSPRRLTNTSQRTTTSSRVDPLSAEEQQRVRQVANRLRSELRDLMSVLPRHVTSGPGLEKHLKIDRGTAQRVLSVVHHSGNDLDVFSKCPGVQGLTRLVQAARKNGLSSTVLDSVDAARQEMHDVVGKLAGSLANLNRRIQATRDHDRASGPHPFIAEHDSSNREALSHSAVEITGRYSELHVAIAVCRPNPSNADKADLAIVRGVVGSVSRPDSVPLTFRAFFGDGVHEDKSDQQDKDSAEPAVQPLSSLPGSAVVQEFSTPDAPVALVKRGGVAPIVVIDPRSSASGESIDVLFANTIEGELHMPHLSDPPILELSQSIRYPAKWLLMDTYLHESMALHGLPTVHTYLWNPSADDMLLSRHWYARLPTNPPLQLLGRGLTNAASPVYEQHFNLTQYWFDRLGWSADEFIGYRTVAEHPIWGATYCFAMDYSSCG